MDAPFVARTQHVEEAWIDHNGHMNMAYYTVLFDRGLDEAQEFLGLGPAYAEARALTTYTGEIHLCYLRELHCGDPVDVTNLLMECDEKRLRWFQEMRHRDGWLAATCECLSLHVDRTGPRVAPFPADIAARVETMRKAHAILPRPNRAGRAIVMRRPG